MVFYAIVETSPTEKSEDASSNKKRPKTYFELLVEPMKQYDLDDPEGHQ